VIEGEVVNSVISPGVYIGKNSIIRNSIILNDTIISDNVTVDNCIIDKHVTIGVNSIVGEGANDTPNKEKPEVLNCGITVAEKGAVIPSNVRIGRNVRIKEKAEFKSNIVANGETI
jgi:glucose-1-phosphate adenylyltransferase